MPNTQRLRRIPEFYFSRITEKVSGHPVLIASDVLTAHTMPPCILEAAQSVFLIFVSVKVGVSCRYFFTVRVGVGISVQKRNQIFFVRFFQNLTTIVAFTEKAQILVSSLPASSLESSPTLCWQEKQKCEVR